ncbi:hypothetical protein KIL84_022159 [Mauremys mutica]|uniref:Uncharacterized protein n=1 Tax=Mauremys mutica TaxID=74926 RepID=A0A9D4AZN3_9SAUR|nr:hypothetical protein KIL84_022159 [Mauremys mutica]
MSRAVYATASSIASDFSGCVTKGKSGCGSAAVKLEQEKEMHLVEVAVAGNFSLLTPGLAFLVRLYGYFLDEFGHWKCQLTSHLKSLVVSSL